MSLLQPRWLHPTRLCLNCSKPSWFQSIWLQLIELQPGWLQPMWLQPSWL